MWILLNAAQGQRAAEDHLKVKTPSRGAKMTEKAIESSEITCLLPERIVVLGQALTPVVATLRRSTSRRVRPSGKQFAALDGLSHHSNIIFLGLSHFSDRFQEMVRLVILNEMATDLETGRVVGRLEQVLSDFAEGLRESLGTIPEPGAEEPRTLIIGVYRHHLSEICDWLDELAKSIADPLSALKRRKLPVIDNVALTVNLNLTTPPQMARLQELVRGFTTPAPVETPVIRTASYPRSRPGFLGVLGALAFGLKMANGSRNPRGRW